MKDYNKFYTEVMNFVSNRPKKWRPGQAVFNYIEQFYGVARYVQFEKGIDCFYNNSKINDFINASYEAINDNIEKK